MSRLTELASKATARPWLTAMVNHRPSVVADDWGDIPATMVDAALIVALVNRVDDIQRLWDAANACTSYYAYKQPPLTNLHDAVNDLRDLLGGDHVSD